MQNKKKNIINTLKKEFFSSLNFIKDSKKFICIISLIFFLSFLIGLIIKFPENIQDSLLELIKKIVLETKNLSGVKLILFIIFNNLKSTFFGIIFGIFFGIIPVISAFLNGLLLGFVSSLSISKNGIISLWRIFPHGIFEIPAIFISLGLGLRIGISFLKGKKNLKKLLIKSIKTYFLLIIFLIIIAGIIEGVLISVLK
jgi:stage II sporulation protein M